MAEIVWTESADDIGDYIAKDSLRYAELTVAKLFESQDIGIATERQNTNQHRTWDNLARVTFNYMQWFPGKVHLEVFSWPMIKMHRCLISLIIPGKMLAKLGITITIRVGCLILLPEDLTGYPRQSQLLCVIGELLLKIK